MISYKLLIIINYANIMIKLYNLKSINNLNYYRLANS